MSVRFSRRPSGSGAARVVVGTAGYGWLAVNCGELSELSELSRLAWTVTRRAPTLEARCAEGRGSVVRVGGAGGSRLIRPAAPELRCPCGRSPDRAVRRFRSAGPAQRVRLSGSTRRARRVSDLGAVGSRVAHLLPIGPRLGLFVVPLGQHGGQDVVDDGQHRLLEQDVNLTAAEPAAL